MKSRVIVEPVVTGDTFPAMVENSGLHHMIVGTVFHLCLDGVPLHFSHRVCAFLDREFPDHWTGRVGPIPWPFHSPHLTPLDFFWGFLKDIVYHEKVQNVNELHDRTVRASECLTNKCFPVPAKILNIILVFAVP
jgi:hypothetical protein